MKEFGKTVKQTFQVWSDELGVFSFISLCGGIFGIVLGFIMVNSGDMDGEYANIGAIIGLIIGMMFILILNIFSLPQYFNMAITMGKTRKHFVPARFLFMVVNSTLCLITVLGITLVENFMYPIFYPGTVCAFDMMELLFHPAALVGFLFGVPAITLVCGACTLKFGPKCTWVFWALWMLFCIGFPRMLDAVNAETDSIWKRMGEGFVNFVSDLTAVQVVIGMLIAGLVALGAAYALLRKQRVTA